MAAAEAKPVIRLHWLNGSRAQGILWLLEELEVPYELQTYHRTKDLLAPPELRKLHPLGKSPLVTIETPDSSDPPVVLAETGFIVQYLSDHFGEGKDLVPTRWKAGQEGKLGGETEEWLRFRHLLYYGEGSFVPYIFVALLLNNLKGPRIPFLIRPITSVVASRVMDFLVVPNMKKHLEFLERQLETSPGGGAFLCGSHLTAGDIALAFPLLWGMTEFGKMGLAETSYPRTFAYIRQLESQAGWKRAADKIREIEGSYSLLP